MKLLTKSIRDRLLQNGRLTIKYRQQHQREPDFVPVVKLFTPDAQCTWLITEIDPSDEDIAFGLCDLGMGYPALGSVRLSELERVRGLFGLPVERDRFFSPKKTISAYAEDARLTGAIRA